MSIDPLGLAGKSKEVPRNIKKTKTKSAGVKRTRAESLKLLKEIFRPAREEKMRRKWDSVE